MLNEPEGMIVEPRSNTNVSLVDRLDPAIGEATSGMGALLTELIRRSIRGGVQKVDDELSTYVVEQVSDALSHKLPEIEKAAEEVATEKAVTTASGILRDGIDTIEKKTSEVTKALESQLGATAEQLRQATEDCRQTLTAKIDDTEKRVTETTRQSVDEKYEDILQRSKGTAAQLRDQIGDVSKQLSSTHQEFVNGLTLLADQMRQETGRQEQRLSETSNRLVDLDRQVRQEVPTALRSFADQLEQSRRVHEQLSQTLSQLHQRLKEHMDYSEQANAEIGSRLAELEKPRGIKALFSRLLGKKNPSDKPT